MLLRLGADCRGCGSWKSRRSLGGGGCFALLACCQCIPAIRQSETSAYGHQDRATPDPIDKWFVVNTHAPGTGANRFAQGNIQIAGKTGVDGSFGHYVSRRRVSALFRVHFLLLVTVLAHHYFRAR